MGEERKYKKWWCFDQRLASGWGAVLYMLGILDFSPLGLTLNFFFMVKEESEGYDILS